MPINRSVSIESDSPADKETQSQKTERRASGIVVAVIALVTLALLGAGCSIGDAVSSANTTPFTAEPAPKAPTPVHISACLDWSPSVELAARRSARRDLAELVRTWPVARPGAQQVKSERGLDLRIRKVLGDEAPSAGISAEVVHVQIPSTPKLGPTPSPDGDHFVELNQARIDQERALRSLTTDARKVRARSNRAISSADFQATSSDVVGCLEGAARAQPAGTVVVISDFLQADANGPALRRSPIAELKGRKVVMVVACAAKGQCGSTLTAWRRFLADTQLEVIPPERLADRLAEFRGGA